MKLALICTEKLPVPPVAGGAIQLYIEGILPYLSQEHDITVFSIKYQGLPDEETRDNVRYIRLAAKSASEYLKNLETMISNEYDLIHVFNRPKWVLTLGRSLPDTKFSLSLHNEMFHTEKISDSDALECVNRVEFINTVSKFIADGVKKRVPIAESKLNVVYSGADTEKFKPNWTHEGIMNKIRLKEEYDIKGYRVILSVGRLSNKKGIHILMQAVKGIMDQYDDVALVIVGSKWYGKNETDDYTISLDRIAGSLRGPIIFTGFVPPSRVPLYYNFGDIFVCASQWNEPLARVHYEAMAAGLPIITTNRGGNGEVIENYGNGIVIDDYTNSYEFKDCMNYLLLNPKKAEEMGIKGRKMAEENYNWERVAGEVLKPTYSERTIEQKAVCQDFKEETEPSGKEEKNILKEEKIEEFFNFNFE